MEITPRNHKEQESTHRAQTCANTAEYAEYDPDLSCKVMTSSFGQAIWS